MDTTRVEEVLESLGYAAELYGFSSIIAHNPNGARVDLSRGAGASWVVDAARLEECRSAENEDELTSILSAYSGLYPAPKAVQR